MAVIIVLTAAMAPDAGWATYVTAGLAAAGGFAVAEWIRRRVWGTD